MLIKSRDFAKILYSEWIRSQNKEYIHCIPLKSKIISNNIRNSSNCLVSQEFDRTETEGEYQNIKPTYQQKQGEEPRGEILFLSTTYQTWHFTTDKILKPNPINFS